MNGIKINDVLHKVPGDGVGYYGDSLVIKFFKDNLTVEELKEVLTASTGDFELYNEDGSVVVAYYKGFTKLESISVSYDTIVEGEKVNLLCFTMLKPTLADKVAQNAADIASINEAIASLAEAIGEK